MALDNISVVYVENISAEVGSARIRFWRATMSGIEFMIWSLISVGEECQLAALLFADAMFKKQYWNDLGDEESA